MKASRSKDNCYLCISLNREDPSTCLVKKVDETKIWNQKLGHLNFKSMKKTVSDDPMKGLPKLKIGDDKVCGEFQIGKQTNIPHKKL